MQARDADALGGQIVGVFIRFGVADRDREDRAVTEALQRQ